MFSLVQMLSFRILFPMCSAPWIMTQGSCPCKSCGKDFSLFCSPSFIYRRSYRVRGSVWQASWPQDRTGRIHTGRYMPGLLRSWRTVLTRTSFFADAWAEDHLHKGIPSFRWTDKMIYGRSITLILCFCKIKKQKYCAKTITSIRAAQKRCAILLNCNLSMILSCHWFLFAL